MLVSVLSTVIAFAGAVLAAGPTLMNTTTAGSKVTWPTANSTIPLNGTVYVQWEWKEETSPSLMVLLTNANKTIFHAAGHAPGGLGMSGVGLYDLNKIANATNTTFGPLKTAGDESIKPGGGYHIVLRWDNTGEDKAANPYNFLQSEGFSVSAAAPDNLPEGVKSYNAPKEPASGAVGGAGIAAGAVLAAVGAACLF